MSANRSSGDDAPAEAAPPRPNVPAGTCGHAGDDESCGEVVAPATVCGCAAAGDNPPTSSGSGGASARREAGFVRTVCPGASAAAGRVVRRCAFVRATDVAETGSARRVAGCAGAAAGVGAEGA